MRTTPRTALTGLAVLGTAGASAHGGTINPTSYAMPNGGTGSYVYHDDTHPDPDSVVDYGALSGGVGDLTDGVYGSNFWDLVNGPANANVPWVGWSALIPVITFDFGSNQNFDTISVHANNGGPFVGYGGVDLPTSVVVEYSTDNATYFPWTTITPTGAQLAFAGSSTLSDDPANAVGRYLRVTANHQLAGGSWVFISEIDFTDASQNVIPLPTSAALALAGLTACTLRRRR